ncbi:MAG: ParB N-terminal domain-containing protein [Phycisphaerales bacterium]|nr:MAG: ParB N-terminal domain-containing protein [Phycisphaerales bacterium]
MTESHPPTFIMKLEAIQPSQLYVSAGKLGRINEEIAADGNRAIQPLPVRQIGDHVVLTDGHTRVLAAHLRGMTEIQVWWDEDDMDWDAYEICVGWCREEGIQTIADLKDRVVEPPDYQCLWLDRCGRLHEELKMRRGKD